MPRFLTRLGAAAAMLTLLAGTPVGLIAFGGNPADAGHALLNRLTVQDDGSWLLALITIVGWAFWLAFTVCVLAEVPGIFGRRTRKIPGLNRMQLLAGVLLAAIFTPVLNPSIAGAARAATPTDTVAQAVAVASQHAASDAPASTTAKKPDVQYQLHEVTRGDTLIGLSHKYFGTSDGIDAITSANYGITQPDGRSLQHGQTRIYTGWTLRIPVAASEATQTEVSTDVADHVKVERGDTLFSIADTHLGDGDRWTEIYELNKDSYDMRGGDHIEATWVLTLPATAALEPGGQPATTTPADQPPAQPSTAPPQVPATSPSAAADDGIAPDTTPAAGTEQPAPTGSDTQQAATAEHDGFRLASGSFVAAGLALLLTGAAAAVWRIRRRDYRRREPQPELRMDLPEAAPLPAPVTQVRQAVTAAHSTPAFTAEPSPANPVNAGWEPAEWPAAGLGLTGPGAEAAARALLVHALAAQPAQGPESRTQVVIPAATLATLFGAAAVELPAHPRMLVTGDIGEALQWAERQQLARTRAVYDYEVEDVDALRDADPLADPIAPVMLLIADATASHHRARVSALLLQGSRLDIHGTLLGGWPDGPSLHIDTDGTTTGDDADAPQRMSVLSAAEAAGVLGVLTEAATGQLATAPRPAQETIPDEKRAETFTAAGDTDDEDLVSGFTIEQEEPQTGHTDDEAGPPVAVRVLGGAVIDGGDDAQPPLRGKARELLVYLAARDGKAAQYAIFEDLLPEAPRSKAPGRLHTYVYNLRQHLTAIGGEAEYIAHPQGSYVLNSHRLKVDLWQMHASIAMAAKTTNRDEKIAAWWQAIGFYRGPLADGYDYEWIESYRNGLHRQILDVYLALADAIATAGQHDQALAVLRVALEHDPIAEATYRQAMDVNAAIGDADAIRALRRDLVRHLEELDLPATEQTLAHAEQLLAQLRKRPGRPAGGA